MDGQNAQLQALTQGMPQGSPQDAPMGAPMSTPQAKEGDLLQAKNQVTIAMQMLEQALYTMGSHSDEGRLVMDVLSKLSKHFHKEDTNELVPAQIMAMMQGLPQVGGGNPDQMAMMRAQQQPQGAGAPPTM